MPLRWKILVIATLLGAGAACGCGRYSTAGFRLAAGMAIQKEADRHS